MNENPDIVTEEAPLIVLYRNSAACMANNSKDAKHTKHIARRVHFLSNGEKCKCTRLIGVREVCNW